MGAQFIPGPDIGGSLASIGQSIGQILDPNRERREQVEELFLTNPQILQQFAEAQREAERQFNENPPVGVGDAALENVAPNVLEQFGHSLSQTKQILAAAPETGKERLRGVQERADLAEAEARISESNLRTNLANARDARGIPGLQATEEFFKLSLGTDLSDAQSQALADYNVILEDLRETNPAEFGRAIAAQVSPQYLTDIRRAEELQIRRDELALRGQEIDLRNRLAEISGASSDADRFLKTMNLRLDAQTKMNALVKDLNTAFEDGTEEEKELAMFTVNQAVALSRALNPSGLTFQVSPGDRRFLSGNLKNFRLEGLAPGNIPLELKIEYEQALAKFETAPRDEPFESFMTRFLQLPAGTAFLAKLEQHDPSRQLGLVGAFNAQAQQQFQTISNAPTELPEAVSGVPLEQLDEQIRLVEEQVANLGDLPVAERIVIVRRLAELKRERRERAQLERAKSVLGRRQAGITR